MSQGDSTFNATRQIKVLLREIDLCRRPGSGYDHGDASAIVDAIEIIRKRADAMEMAQGLSMRVEAMEAEALKAEALKAVAVERAKQEQAYINSGSPFAPPPYPYQRVAGGGFRSTNLNGLGFSGD